MSLNRITADVPPTIGCFPGKRLFAHLEGKKASAKAGIWTALSTREANSGYGEFFEEFSGYWCGIGICGGGGGSGGSGGREEAVHNILLSSPKVLDPEKVAEPNPAVGCSTRKRLSYCILKVHLRDEECFVLRLDV